MRSLALDYLKLPAACWSAFYTFSNLRSLRVSGTPITDEGVATLVSCLGALEEFYLTDCEKITDSSFAYLPRLRHLRLLNIAFCEQITANTVNSFLLTCTWLTSLNCNNCP